MGAKIEKIADVEYDELFTLGVIEQIQDLDVIFRMDVNLPYNVLYELQKEGKLSSETKLVLREIFDEIILTKQVFIEKYYKISNGDVKITPIENSVDEPISQEPSVEVVEKPKTKAKTKAKVESKVEPIVEDKLPRRYGKEKILKDIELQKGKATPVQRAMLKVNDLKNIYVNLSTKGIKDMVGNAGMLSDEDCRKIVSAITTFERQMADIVKTKSKKK
jgi:hypothetical protein